MVAVGVGGVRGRKKEREGGREEVEGRGRWGREAEGDALDTWHDHEGCGDTSRKKGGGRGEGEEGEA